MYQYDCIGRRVTDEMVESRYGELDLYYYLLGSAQTKTKLGMDMEKLAQAVT